MTNGNQLTREEQAWLVEYQALQNDNSSSSLSYWTLAGIFIGFTSAILGGLIYGVLSNCQLLKIILGIEYSETNREFLMLGIISWVLSMVVLIILYFLKGWLKRNNFLSQLNYKRMRQIEIKLNMRKAHIVRAIDDWAKLTQEKESEIKDYLKEFYQTHKEQIERDYILPSGIWHHRWIFGALFFLWGLLFVASIYLLCQYACCLAVSFAVIGVIFWLAILLWEKIKIIGHLSRSNHLDQ